MATAITAEMFVAALKKRGIRYRFYKDFADFKVHNRNKQQGFGPLYGTLNHNFASDISDASSARYLYNGDLARGMPGPLSQVMIEDDGTLVLIGWGTANHAGPGDPAFLAALKKDSLPLDRDFKPVTNGSSPSAVRLNPNVIGQEMAYGAKGTAAQYKTMIQFNAVMMELLGGPDNGYSGGSVGAHRETTTSRSDPTGFTAHQIRNDVNELLAIWNKAVPSLPIPPVPGGPIVSYDTTKPAPDIQNPTAAQIWGWDGIRAFNADDPNQTNDYWGAGATLTWMYRTLVDVQKKAVAVMDDTEEIKTDVAEIKVIQQRILDALTPDEPPATVV